MPRTATTGLAVDAVAGFVLLAPPLVARTSTATPTTRTTGMRRFIRFSRGRLRSVGLRCAVVLGSMVISTILRRTMQDVDIQQTSGATSTWRSEIDVRAEPERVLDTLTD